MTGARRFPGSSRSGSAPSATGRSIATGCTVHGRTNGYWDTSRGEQSRRKCIECHDPHQPPFPPMRPAPGPETLRMGPQGPGGHGEVRNPLRVAGHGEDAAAGDFEPEEGN